MAMLKYIWKSISNLWTKTPQEGEPEEEYAGQITIRWDTTTEEIAIDTNVDSLSEGSAELMAHVLYGLGRGHLDELIGTSITLWADKDEEKATFMASVALLYKFIETAGQDQESEAEENSGNTLAVDPSQVFGFRGGLNQQQ